MTIHTRLHMRTGDEIQDIVDRAEVCRRMWGMSWRQHEWATTFLTLPPNEYDLESEKVAA